MSRSVRKRVTKWDTNEENTQQLNENDYTGNGRSKSRSRRSSMDDDNDEHLKSRQHSGEAWATSPSSNKVSHEIDYNDGRKSSEQAYFHQPSLREKPRTRRSGSRSNSRSRSRSRSPLQRVRRDAGGSYDRHKTRERVSPRPERESNGRYNRDNDYDSREQQQPLKVGGRSDYASDFPKDNNYRRESSARDREMQRRDFPEGEFRRSSDVPCRFFASGYCRNGNNCRFSHHGAPPSRQSPDRKPQGEMFSKHDNNSHSGTTERMRNSRRWNDNERSDTRNSFEVKISIAKPEVKGNNDSWLDDTEMSPDWNYGAKNLKKPMKDEHSVLNDTSEPQFQHVSASSNHNFSNNLANTAHPVQAFNQINHIATRTLLAVGGNQILPPAATNFPNSSVSTVDEKIVASSNYANSAPPVQAFYQNIENHTPLPYQNIPLAVGGSQMLPPGGLHSSNPENGNAQSTSVSREELNHISNISASLAQFFGNGQPIPQVQIPQVNGEKEQSSHPQSDLLSNTGEVPVVAAFQINNNNDTQQVQIPDNLVSLDRNDPMADSEGKGDIKTEEEAIKEVDLAEDVEKVVEEEEEEDGGVDDEKNNKKKGKDHKGMKAFKFALVEIVKELLKPAWKEGGMNKDAYKNIVKKVVDKVTGAIQTGNIPQTQEKIDHYLSASKPKLTKLVQAYVSKVKKS